MPSAVILAAGASTRLGQPKALLRLGDEAAVTRAARLLAEAGFEASVVVAGAHTEAIRAAPLARGARLVVNDSWQRGRTGSVQTGVRALPADQDVLVWPIDHPAVALATLRALRQADGPIRVPTFQGRRGHPTWFGRLIRKEILALGPDQPLHDVLHQDAARVREVPVDDEGVLFNVDTLDDLKKLDRFLGGSGHARAPA